MEVAQIGSQQQLRSLQAAVETATSKGIPYDKLTTVGGWEMKFGRPRAEGQLPALIHALPVQ
jgi:filamentous hemagglutinin